MLFTGHVFTFHSLFRPEVLTCFGENSICGMITATGATARRNWRYFMVIPPVPLGFCRNKLGRKQTTYSLLIEVRTKLRMCYRFLLVPWSGCLICTFEIQLMLSRGYRCKQKRQNPLTEGKNPPQILYYQGLWIIFFVRILGNMRIMISESRYLPIDWLI